MIRIVNLNMAFLALAVAIAFGNYQVKYEVQRKEKQLAAINAQIAEEHGRQRLLMADWSLLNEPQRLQDLATKYLDLGEVAASQVASVTELPERLAALSRTDKTGGRDSAIASRIDRDGGATRVALNR